MNTIAGRKRHCIRIEQAAVRSVHFARRLEQDAGGPRHIRSSNPAQKLLYEDFASPSRPGKADLRQGPSGRMMVLLEPDELDQSQRAVGRIIS
jgi:hypothetical protein